MRLFSFRASAHSFVSLKTLVSSERATWKHTNKGEREREIKFGLSDTRLKLKQLSFWGLFCFVLFFSAVMRARNQPD